MRALVLSLLTLAACGGRVDAPVVDAAVDTSETLADAGLCSPTHTEDCGDALQRHYYRVDRARGCIDFNAGPQLAMCGCLKLAVDCWVEQATGDVFYSPCRASMPPGYCRCDRALKQETVRMSFCP